jgi:hypothetical protein
LCQSGRDLAANAPAAAGDECMWGTRQSGHALDLPNELLIAEIAYILDLKLLQEITPRLRQSRSLLDGGSAGPSGNCFNYKVIAFHPSLSC